MDIIIPYSPHAGQLSFHKSIAKYRLLCTGAGFGKSTAGANELIKDCMTSESGCMYAIIAPTYKMLINATLREFWKFCPRNIVKKFNRSDMIIEFINGVSIVCVAGDREDTIDRMRGMTLAGAWGDEIRECPEYLHEIIVSRIRDPRGSMKITYTTTPAGFNWIYRLFIEKKLKNGDPIPNPQDYDVFTGSTLDNPHTPEEYKQNMLNTMTGVFAKQEIYGGFVGFEGLVYSDFNRDTHVIDTKHVEFKDIIAGVDFGFNNPSAMVKIGIDYDGRYYVIDEFYESHVTDSELATWTHNNWKDVRKFTADSANPSGIEEFNKKRLRCEGVKKTTDSSGESFVLAGIKEITRLLQRQNNGDPMLFIDKKCVNLIKEFEYYRYDEDKEGKPKKELPIKLFDHALDALRYIIGIKKKDVCVIG